MGFDASWGVLGASDIGAKHHRKRIWIVARRSEFLSHPNNRKGWWQQQSESVKETQRGNMAYTNNPIGGGERRRFWGAQKRYQEWDLHSIFNQPEPLRMADGVASRVDRLKAIGNGQVPQVAGIAWNLLKERLDGQR
jgi:DNA (cytosine-5)-methyltransferase 1